MSTFTILSELISVREQSLKEIASLVPLSDVKEIPTFKEPLALYHKWLQMPGEVPHFDNVKASSFSATLLPNMYILDVVPEEDPENDTGDVDLRFRLFGTANRENYGKEATGARLSQSAANGSDAGVADGFAIARQAYHTRNATFMVCNFYKDTEVVRTASFVVLPLCDDGGAIVRLFGCAAWT